MRTLSGGEAQRIQLATALGGVLTASLYVLDEPSIGLHPRDTDRLVRVLERIRDQGNTVVVVEHAPEIVAAADHVIDLGPRGGRLGGRLVFEGSVAELRAHPDSLTGRALRGEFRLRTRPPRPRQGQLRIVGARAHNLKDVTVEIPLRQLVVVSGVSGAGKSSLIGSVLVGHLRRDPERGECDRIEGASWLSEVVVVEPGPPARSSRSNPATVSKAFDAIRRRFAETREARRLGLAAGWFSFNVPGGRCEACEGAGEVVVDMQFLDDVRMPCEACDGRRYRPEAVEIRVAGRSIVEVLALTVDEALEVFANDGSVAPRLRPLADVGLGYLAIGQPLSTLSGGELQRLRIAQALGAGETHALYVLDEPTTGLHPADVELLLASLDRILDAGGSVIVIEHNLDVIRRADHVIDLGSRSRTRRRPDRRAGAARRDRRLRGVPHRRGAARGGAPARLIRSRARWASAPGLRKTSHRGSSSPSGFRRASPKITSGGSAWATPRRCWSSISRASRAAPSRCRSRTACSSGARGAPPSPTSRCASTWRPGAR